jgi:hypothetical protein
MVIRRGGQIQISTASTMRFRRFLQPNKKIKTINFFALNVDFFDLNFQGPQ